MGVGTYIIILLLYSFKPLFLSPCLFAGKSLLELFRINLFRRLLLVTAAKSDFAGLLKDGFQTLAVFMPCFASQSPAGLQIYLVSSFTFTLFQGAALRNDTIRNWIGLPAMGTAPTEPKYAKEFMEFKKLEQKAKEIRGDGPVLGKNVLAVGFETSFPGTKRPSTIETHGLLPPEIEPAPLPQKPKLDFASAQAAWGGHFVHGVSAPMEQLEEQLAEQMKEQQAKEIAEQKAKESEKDYMFQPQDNAMEAANKGVIIAPTTSSDKQKSPEKINPKQCKGCLEKEEFIKKVQDTEHLAGDEF